jgi:hypothetical protein
VRSTFRNEIFWCSECVHIPILAQMIMIPSASSPGCKICDTPPFCVAGCSGQIYYVVCRLQYLSRATIHLGVHNHLVVNGKC